MAGHTERDAGSFRDPSGFIFWQDGQPYRQIQRSFATEWDAFEASPLKQRLIDGGRLIPYEPVPIELAQGADAHAVIRPEKIEFISYPYEWTFGELRDAALLTLDAQLDAMAEGWQLKDASAYNVQFRDARPILIDSLSFEPLDDGAPWVAYRQFCEHFLAPLALIARRDVRLASLLRADPDGVPLDLASGLLPWRTRLNFGLAVACPPPRSSPTALRRQRGRRRRRRREGARISRRAARGPHPEPAWHGRAACAGSRPGPSGPTTPTTRATAMPRPRTRRDSWSRSSARRRGRGSGTSAPTPAGTAGSRPMPASGSSPSTSTRQPRSGNYRQLRTEGRADILPLILDVANPSPGIGWAGRERRSLLDRADPDITLALALVHHLAISRNVPLPMVLGLFADLAPWAIVEFVPKEDRMVRRLLATRRDVFPEYTLDGFRTAATERFEVVQEAPIEDSLRVLFLLRRR